jgi:signal transduction histidine kinase
MEHSQSDSAGNNSRMTEVGENTVRIMSAGSRGVVPVPRSPGAAADHELLRRQLMHDIRHGLGTIMMLASLLGSGSDVGPEGQRRASQLLGEARWLELLQRAQEDTAADGRPAQAPALKPIRLDLCAREVVAVLSDCTPATIEMSGPEAWANVDRLAFWRAMRNVVSNAARAAGPHGRVAVRVEHTGDWTVVQVDDDGPGFGRAPAGTASLGLDIVQQSVSSWGGRLEIRRSQLGGCCVRMHLSAAAPPDTTTPAVVGFPVVGGIDAAVDL